MTSVLTSQTVTVAVPSELSSALPTWSTITFSEPGQTTTTQALTAVPYPCPCQDVTVTVELPSSSADGPTSMDLPQPTIITSIWTVYPDVQTSDASAIFGSMTTANPETDARPTSSAEESLVPPTTEATLPPRSSPTVAPFGNFTTTTVWGTAGTAVRATPLPTHSVVMSGSGRVHSLSADGANGGNFQYCIVMLMTLAISLRL